MVPVPSRGPPSSFNHFKFKVMILNDLDLVKTELKEQEYVPAFVPCYEPYRLGSKSENLFIP